ncbi:VWA domain-containing protein [Akkermansiaceae bacterium]|nr:VWA domain-containing protein [Akkermansiaceae bacterium]
MKTEIAFILDRSSSMESIRTAAINGFNQYLRDQQAAPGRTNLSLVFFDTDTEHRYESLPAAEILPLNMDTYVPRGCTALLDAIGETIDKLGKKLAALPAADRPDHVSVAILTDGEENSSTRFTWKDIAERIKHQTGKYDWEFLFLGASEDAIATAAKMNIHAHNSSAYLADAAGSQAAMASFSRKSLASRAKKSGLATPEQLHDADAPMSDILREEDQKRRQ